MVYGVRPPVRRDLLRRDFRIDFFSETRGGPGRRGPPAQPSRRCSILNCDLKPLNFYLEAAGHSGQVNYLLPIMAVTKKCVLAIPVIIRVRSNPRLRHIGLQPQRCSGRALHSRVCLSWMDAPTHHMPLVEKRTTSSLPATLPYAPTGRAATPFSPSRVSRRKSSCAYSIFSPTSQCGMVRSDGFALRGFAVTGERSR